MNNHVFFCIATSVLVFALQIISGAQTYNAYSGGYNTGYGTVYGSFGLAMATQQIYQTTQMQIQRLTMRQAMIKKWGVAAVEKAEREARSGIASLSQKSNTSGPVVPPPPAPKYYGKFRPDPSANMIQKIADSLGETPEEKALLKQIIDGVKASFEKETKAKGWNNNIAGAMTFFLVSTATIYHDAGEPDIETTKAIYDAVNLAIDDLPEFANAPNKDKQATYDLLIGFGAIPLATYADGKQNGSAETVEVARKLSGELIRLVLKTDPEKVKFGGKTPQGEQ